MRKQFYLIILCVLIFACDTEKSSHEKNEKTDEVETPSTEMQTFTQTSRRVMKGGDKIGEMKEIKQYGENDKLGYYAVYDYSKYDKSKKSGKVSALLYGDENKKEEIGKVIYTYNNKTVLMETFDKGEAVASVAEYIEYIDDDLTYYTVYCQYFPAEGNKVAFYRVSDFNPGTLDYTREEDYFADGLTWDPKNHRPIGNLKSLERNICQYNATVLPGTNDKQHQWTSEVYDVNEYSESGEKLSERKYQYDFIWNEKICATTHLQQDSFEIDPKTGEFSVNDTVRKSFQIFGNEPKMKRKSWISADGETKYYYRYEYATEPNDASKYYRSCEDLVDISEGVEYVSNRKTYFHYIDDDGSLIYEETESSGNELQRSVENNKFGFTIMPERYGRGR